MLNKPPKMNSKQSNLQIKKANLTDASHGLLRFLERKKIEKTADLEKLLGHTFYQHGEFMDKIHVVAESKGHEKAYTISYVSSKGRIIEIKAGVNGSSGYLRFIARAHCLLKDYTESLKDEHGNHEQYKLVKSDYDPALIRTELESLF